MVHVQYIYELICSIGLFNHEAIHKITTSFDYGCESSAVPSPLTATILQSADKTRLGQTGKVLILVMAICIVVACLLQQSKCGP